MIANDNRSAFGASTAETGAVLAEIHGFSEPDAVPTPWAEGLRQVQSADTFWLSTVRPDRRPHVTPLTAVWHADAIWFTTGADERKARNLATNPSCLLTTGRSDLTDGALDVVLEGVADQVRTEEHLRLVAAAFAAKYGTKIWDYAVHDGGFIHRQAGDRLVASIVYRLRPVRGLGFRKGDRFSQTTWRFPR